MLATLGLVLGFRSSSALAAAYGIAVTLTMLITTMLAYLVARGAWGVRRAVAGSLALFFFLIELAFFGATQRRAQPRIERADGLVGVGGGDEGLRRALIDDGIAVDPGPARR